MLINNSINVCIRAIVQARLIAECERRSRAGKGLRFTLSVLVDDYGWSLMALPEAIERELQNRYSSGKELPGRAIFRRAKEQASRARITATDSTI